MGRVFRIAVLRAALAATAVLAVEAGVPGVWASPTLPSGTTAQAVPFSALDGWDEDDHAAALAAFAIACRPIVDEDPALDQPVVRPPGLIGACRTALAGVADARAFFERFFVPLRITTATRPLLTGYFEPEVPGALTRSDAFPHALHGPPPGLEARPEPSRDGPLAGLTAARRVNGALQPLPDRAAIETGALGDAARPIAFVADEVTAFTIHVQGSARLRLPDGSSMRVAFAGRNGHPYRSIGRIMVAEGLLRLEEASMDNLVAWIRARPDEGRRIMRMNPSFIFFRRATELDPARGPKGAAASQLTPGRSLAVDRTIWPYGLPAWISAETADVPGLPAALRRLVVVQDTGAAIVGPVRGDLFVGSGDAAGLTASRLRHPLTLTILWPRNPS